MADSAPLAATGMQTDTIHIIRGHLTGDAPLDTAISRTLLKRVSDGELPETLQIGLPHSVVAFGKHDALTKGFSHAVSIATGYGYDPTVRIAGGRAVVFHRDVVRFAWTLPIDAPLVNIHDRFDILAERTITAINSFGIDAVVGQLAGEYCPGRYSVSIPGIGKVMGSGQRLTRKAAQIGGMIVIRGAEAINSVLVPVYESLHLDMDPHITGAVSEAAAVDAELFMDRFVEQFVEEREPSFVDIDHATRTAALDLRHIHDPG